MAGLYDYSNGALAPYMPGAIDSTALDPSTVGLLNFGSGILAASGPSRVPVSLGSALGQGMQAGLTGYSAAQNAAAQQALQRAHIGLLNQQMRKAQLDADLTSQMMGGGALTDMSDPEKVAQLGYRLAAAGHPGGATLIDRAQKMVEAQQNRAAVESFRSTPGTLGAGVTTTSPQGQALLGNLSGDTGFDQGVLQAQNEALNANARPTMPARPVAAPNPGLFGPLLSSPYVGPSAQSMQNQLDTTRGIPAKEWLGQYDRLQQLHSTGVNQAAARQDTASLRRDLADQNDARARELAALRASTVQDNRDNNQENRRFTQERQLSENYNALAKDFRRVLPQFQSAAQYVAGSKYDSSGDRALVFQFAKTLDPQDRVGVNDVKDINKLGNVPERIVQAVQSLAEGKMLPDRVRQEMFAVMRQRFEAMNEQQADIENEYSDRAKRYMLNASNVVLPYAVRREAQGGWSIRQK